MNRIDLAIADLYKSRILSVLLLVVLGTIPSTASAFWLLGFSSADTLPPGALGVIAGTGAQVANVGKPEQTSFTPFLPHAGFRYGVSDNMDVGYRLTQVALPYSSAGPSLGGELDAKYQFAPSANGWRTALVGGMAYSYLDISGVSKSAWSPGVDWVMSRVLTPKYTLISELRYVYTAIPSATGGSANNYVNALGVDLGTKIKLTQQVSLIPEAGLFNLSGQLLGKSANGVGLQMGAVLAIRVW
ncbi:MAG: hypothetical protein ACYC3O_02780 [Burkholderiales bacterium]